ncbi:MAG: FeoB-associated Cys-rich membrane protein [Abditibacteriota bacterium]|nr:FeoB-associated Cys-rich membrane protein [Abditibacteriota bacterium]MBP5094087.1 FeoB-associated Cys-rich membrane protein [Abditibacteriota bacterium]MBP5717596.1 FeoB-associated Cys-rich membrane protein [Abditibacteriota bacterium]
MAEKIIVALIVLAALFFALRYTIKTGGCGCGCDGCKAKCDKKDK